MKKLLLIAWKTYKQRLTSGSFLLLTFAIPLLMVAVVAVPVLILDGGGEAAPQIGILNRAEAGLFQLAQAEGIAVQLYPDEQAAQQAFQAEEIQGYLVVPEGYLQGEAPTFYAAEAPDEDTEQALRQMMRQALLPEAPSWLLERLEEPAAIVYRSAASGETVNAGLGLVIRFGTPAALAIFLALAVLFTSSQLGAAIVEEKEQHSLEIVVTSLRISELVGGKVLGMTLLSLTQLGIWTLGGVIAIAVAVAAGNTLPDISLPWQPFLWALLLGVPAYLLFTLLASALGIIAGDKQQAQQLAGFLGFFGIAPLWLAGALLANPNSVLAVGLTLFPLTAPMFALMRMVLVSVPLWQLVTSLAILVVSLGAALWLTARLFRAVMLLYGQDIKPQQVWLALRQAG